MPYEILFRRFIAIGTLFAFLASFWSLPPVSAQDIFLPNPGQMVPLSPTLKPAVLKGIQLDANQPFRFHFLVDGGDGQLSPEAFKGESSKLIKYFLAALAIPEEDLWVNLSPYEKDRIVPKEFGLTQMGRDLLAQDYLLKQITSSLIYPEKNLGQTFWKRVYALAKAKYGRADVPVNTFNKVWIVPEKAVVYENGGTAFVVENHLKVMLEEDYLATNKNFPSHSAKGGSAFSGQGEKMDGFASQIIREIIIPELTKEVNEGKNFAPLRQVFYSLILATWYKKKISGQFAKSSVLNKLFSNKKRIKGLSPASSLNKDLHDVDFIYEQYLKAFKKGVYNYIKEEADPATRQTVPRKYFSGGVNAIKMDRVIVTVDKNQINPAQRANLDHAQITDVMVGIKLKKRPKPSQGGMGGKKPVNTIFPWVENETGLDKILGSEWRHEIRNSLALLRINFFLLRNVKDKDSQLPGLLEWLVELFNDNVGQSVLEQSKRLNEALNPLENKLGRIIENNSSQWTNDELVIIARMQATVSNLKRYCLATQGDGQLKSDLSTISVNKFLDILQRTVKMFISDKVQITYDPKEIQGTLRADPVIFRVVLTNLLTNAIQAFEESGKTDGKIIVNVKKVENNLVIEINDNGPGISPNNLSKVFQEKFTTKSTGSGLGLGIVQKIIQEHQGSIDVASSLGQGTTFTITLPVDQAMTTPGWGARSQADLVAAKRARMDEVEAEEGFKPYPSTVALIKELNSRGVNLGVGSSSVRAIHIIKALGLRPNFKAVLGGQRLDTGNEIKDDPSIPDKPAAGFFLAVATQIGVDPRKSFVVEDSVVGTLAAKAGGFKVVGLARAGDEELLKNAGADWIVKDIDNLSPGQRNELMHASGVIFDLDGVVVDSEGVNFRVWKEVFDNYFKFRKQEYNEVFNEFTYNEFRKLTIGRRGSDVARQVLSARNIDLPDKAMDAQASKAELLFNGSNIFQKIDYDVQEQRREREEIALRCIKHDKWNDLFGFLQTFSSLVNIVKDEDAEGMSAWNDGINKLHNELRKDILNHKRVDFVKHLVLLRRELKRMELDLDRIPENVYQGFYRLKHYTKEQVDREFSVGVKQMFDLIDDLLTFISGNIDERRGVIDLDQIMSERIALILSTGFNLEIEPLSQNVSLYADRRKLMGIIFTLMTNSRQIASERGIEDKKAELRFDQKNGEVVIEYTDHSGGFQGEAKDLLNVSDNGPNRQKAFLLNTSSRLGGTGLGLAQVYHLVKLHGGDIRADNILGNDGLPVGAKFTIRFPVKKIDVAMNSDFGSQLRYDQTKHELVVNGQRVERLAIGRRNDVFRIQSIDGTPMVVRIVQQQGEQRDWAVANMRFYASKGLGVKVYDNGWTKDRHYYILVDYIDGKSLNNLKDLGSSGLAMLKQLLDDLIDQKILMTDFTPEQLMIGRSNDDARPRIYIADGELAKTYQGSKSELIQKYLELIQETRSSEWGVLAQHQDIVRYLIQKNNFIDGAMVGGKGNGDDRRSFLKKIIMSVGGTQIPDVDLKQAATNLTLPQLEAMVKLKGFYDWLDSVFWVSDEEVQRDGKMVHRAGFSNIDNPFKLIEFGKMNQAYRGIKWGDIPEVVRNPLQGLLRESQDKFNKQLAQVVAYEGEEGEGYRLFKRVLNADDLKLYEYVLLLEQKLNTHQVYVNDLGWDDLSSLVKSEGWTINQLGDYVLTKLKKKYCNAEAYLSRLRNIGINDIDASAFDDSFARMERAWRSALNDLANPSNTTGASNLLPGTKDYFNPYFEPGKIVFKKAAEVFERRKDNIKERIRKQWGDDAVFPKGYERKAMSPEDVNGELEEFKKSAISESSLNREARIIKILQNKGISPEELNRAKERLRGLSVDEIVNLDVEDFTGSFTLEKIKNFSNKLSELSRSGVIELKIHFDLDGSLHAITLGQNGKRVGLAYHFLVGLNKEWPLTKRFPGKKLIVKIPSMTNPGAIQAFFQASPWQMKGNQQDITFRVKWSSPARKMGIGSEENSDRRQISRSSSDTADAAMISTGKKNTREGGINLNPSQMSLETKRSGDEIHFNFNPESIDAAQVSGASFTILRMIPVTSISAILDIQKR